jgi:hypothetical protein
VSASQRPLLVPLVEPVEAELFEAPLAPVAVSDEAGEVVVEAPTLSVLVPVVAEPLVPAP